MTLYRLLASAVATTCLAGAGQAEETRKSAPAITGLFDVYYLYSAGMSGKHHLLAPGHAYYDTRNNTPTLALAELNVEKTALEEGDFGYTLTLAAGDVTDLNHGAYAAEDGSGLTGLDTREGRLRNLAQVFGSYNASGYVVDFGKFTTPFGCEVSEANANPNYSHSLLYALVPTYHGGIRVTTPAYGGVTYSGYLVQSLYNSANAGVNDDNNDKAFIGQAAFASGPLSAVLNAGFSKDKVNLVDAQNVLLTDLVVTYTPGAAGNYAAELLYRKDSRSGDAPEAKTWGAALYYTRTLDARFKVSLRGSWASQKVTSLDAQEAEPTTTTRPWDVTLSGSYSLLEPLTLKAEYRHGGANTAIYTGDGGPATEDSEDTFSFAAIYSF